MFRALSPILSIILAIVIFFFFARPLFSEIGMLQDETSQYREAVEKAAEFNSYLQGLITKRNSYSSLQFERLEALVPESIDEVRALVDIKALAERHGMLFGRIEIGEAGDTRAPESSESGPVTVKDFTTINVSFQVIGDYEQLRAFLGDLERSLVPMDIAEVSFEVGEEDLQLYTITVKLHALNPA